MSERTQVYVVAIAAGLIAETAIVISINTLGGAAQGASIILLLEAIVLGFVFGAGPGTAGAVVPVAGFLLYDLLLQGGGQAEIAVALYLTLLLGFCAWITGTLRARFGRGR